MTTTTTIPNDQYRDMNHNNVVEGTFALNERTERWDVMEDVLPEQQDQGPMDPTVDTMTHEVESLLQFMDQYKTFSPLLNHRNAENTIGHRHHHSKYPTTDEYGHPSSKENRNDENKTCQDHENINNDDDSHYVPADKVTTSMKSRNDLYDPNQLESSFVHHSMVVSNSSSSSASSPLHARQVMDDAQEHNATTGTSTRSMNNTDPSPPLGPVKLPTIPDQENHSPPHVPLPPSSNHWNMDTEREKLRAWVIQVRQAVYEWVQEYREYMMTVQQQQQHLPHPQHQMRPLLMSHDDRKASLPQHPPQDDSDPQIILQRYEQTIVSLNDIIQEQRQRIQDLEMSLGNEGNDSCSNDQQHRNVETSRANHSVTASAVPPRPPSALLVTVVSHDADDHPTTIRQRHDARRTKPEYVGTETRTKQEGTTTTTLPIKTTSAMILKTKNCKRIAYSNGTVHEIYYDDDDIDDDDDIETDRRRSDATTHVVPMPKHHQQQQRRKRLYDIIRYHNGDIKMTTTTAASRQPNDDNKETLEETYYYYSKSGIIRIARHSRSHHPCDGTTTTVNHGRTPAAIHQSSMEYHYPNGQIEYYIGKERVIQLPNGKILNQHDL